MLTKALYFIAHRDPHGFYKYWLENNNKIKHYTFGSVVFAVMSGFVAYLFENYGGMQTAWACSAVVLLFYFFAAASLKANSNFPHTDNGRKMTLDEVIENSGHGGARIEPFLLSPYLLAAVSIIILAISIFG